MSVAKKIPAMLEDAWHGSVADLLLVMLPFGYSLYFRMDQIFSQTGPIVKLHSFDLDLDLGEKK